VIGAWTTCAQLRLNIRGLVDDMAHVTVFADATSILYACVVPRSKRDA